MMKRNIYAVTAAFCLFSAVLGSSALAAGAGAKQLIGIGSGSDSATEPDKTRADEDTSKISGDTEKSTESVTEKQNGWKVAIDPGHQGSWVDMSAQEPSAPGSSEMKAKATTGTTGKFSGLNEYELNLQVSLLLRDELEDRGYEVVMTREDHDTAISNKERAEMANNAGADAFLRIHADGSESSKAKGTSTLCNTASSPYNPDIHEQSKALSQALVDHMTTVMGSKNRGVTETDTMSGINWCTVPVSIVEMGFMTNPEEDELMETADYQAKIVQGIANGVDAYFAGQ